MRLLDAACALVARGDDEFSIDSVCAEAGLESSAFKAHFTGRPALIAALIEPKLEQAVPEPPPTRGPVVAAPDAWLERRLRIFERTLAGLEAQQQTMAREHAILIASLEEKLARYDMRYEEDRAQAAEVAAPVTAMQSLSDIAPECPAIPVVQNLSEIAPDLPPRIEPPPPVRSEVMTPPLALISKEEMAGVLQTAREKLRPVNEDTEPAQGNKRLRWLAFGASALLAAFVGLGLSFGHGDVATAAAMSGAGETHRHIASNPLRAKADAGDAHAQTKLALAYLKGDGVAADKQAAMRWSESAAQAGVPVAQYLLGALYGQGDGVKADPGRAFMLFSQAAKAGNLKAMHNLGIAYAQGLGTAKDETKAAEWFAKAAERGYVDSAFDLAVLYERGEGVTQDLQMALKWYAVAAFKGDKPSQERVTFLRSQMKGNDVTLAISAAGTFAPLPAVQAANAL